MDLDTLLATPLSWLGGGNKACPIVLSSRVRLARNLAEMPFPQQASSEQRLAVWRRLDALLPTLPSLQPACSIRTDLLPSARRRLLFERSLISREHLEATSAGGLVAGGAGDLSVMVNEEDHLRLQAFCPGLALQQAWTMASELDDEIGAAVELAFSSRLGYLTACPSNVGTGLRASVMLHLPGLLLAGDSEAVVRGMGRLGLAVRGLWGEGSEAVGDLYQVSNQVTLGRREEEMMSDLEQVVRDVVGHEKNARERLLRTRPALLRDRAARSLAILSNARLLSSREALEWLSGLRLGVQMGMVQGIDTRVLDEFLILTQPAHLQMMHGESLEANQRDEVRATLLRHAVREANGALTELMDNE